MLDHKEPNNYKESRDGLLLHQHDIHSIWHSCILNSFLCQTIKMNDHSLETCSLVSGSSC